MQMSGCKPVLVCIAVLQADEQFIQANEVSLLVMLRRYFCCPLRTGSSDEVALLIAEFGLLDGELASLLEAVREGHAARLDDDNLARLAVDIPDLRNRLGIG